MIYKSVSEIIGRTPLMEVCNLEKEHKTGARVLIKIEAQNPSGSVKDRAALYMIEDAEAKGLLKPGATIIEPTSGNTGIGLAAIGAAKGYKVLLTMPETMSVERRNILKAYGAEIVLTEGSRGMSGAIAKAQELAQTIEGAFLTAQFENSANAKAHYETTGPEIWQDTEGNVDIFVAGVGTGGTLTGTARYLKEQKAEIQVVAVEPTDSPVLSEGRSGAHPLQGIGAGFIPGVLDTTLYDTVMTVTGEEAYAASKELTRKEGILTGISSGAALHVGLELAKLPENKGKTIVVLLPDSGDRYYSTPLFG